MQAGSIDIFMIPAAFRIDCSVFLWYRQAPPAEDATQKVNMMRTGIVLFLSLNLLACATQQLDWYAEELADQGRPPDYIDGYVDGCDSGYHAAGVPYNYFTRDADRFKTDKLYVDGWNDGFRKCKKEQESVESLREKISY